MMISVKLSTMAHSRPGLGEIIHLVSSFFARVHLGLLKCFSSTELPTESDDLRCENRHFFEQYAYT